MNPLSDASIVKLTQSVQHNCAISDARHARDYSLCVYLLRMREYFRWNQNLPILKTLSVEEVGNWVTEKELWWDEIEQQDYQSITLRGTTFDPFDHEQINQQLRQDKLVYSAGIGRMGQPHFALSILIKHTVEKPIEIYECGHELARDSVTVPAMTRGNCIFVRRDGIRRLLWEMYDDWSLNKNPGPMADIVSHYKLSNDPSLEFALDQASDDLAPLFHAHERGEVMAAERLGETYATLTLSMAGYRAEFYLRALRDLLADTLSTWPQITARAQIHYLDFWLAGLNGVRMQLLDWSGLTRLLATGSAQERLKLLESITSSERTRWEQVCIALRDSFANTDKSNRNKLDVETRVNELLKLTDYTVNSTTTTIR